MYLDYFKLKEYPFSQATNPDFFYDLEGHQEALDILLVSLEMNDGIIKITGAPGTGKTMLCQILLNKLGKHYYPIYLPDPYISYKELMQQLADGLELDNLNFKDRSKFVKQIYNRCVEIKKTGKKIVLLFDEAQGLSPETLESIRIISNMEYQNKRLVQIVLVGGLELDEKLADIASDHFNQRITFSYTLSPMTKKDIKGYVMHRLAYAGDADNQITITPEATSLLHKSTGGSPRMINVLCHKALMLTYSKGDTVITPETIVKAIKDTKPTRRRSKWHWLSLGAVAVTVFLITTIILFFTL